MQRRRFQAGLLQCAVEWRTGGNFWQTTAHPEQPGQSHLARPLFCWLHWLPVLRQRVTYKVALLTHKVRPQPLQRTVFQRGGIDPCTTSGSALIRCSAAGHSLHTHRTGPLHFSVAAPYTWNSLPVDIRLCESIRTFKRHLKTHLFQLT